MGGNGLIDPGFPAHRCHRQLDEVLRPGFVSVMIEQNRWRVKVVEEHMNCINQIRLLIWLGATLSGAAAADPVVWKLKVGELDREALIYLPSQPGSLPAPVVFGFHGHGGNARNAARSFQLQDLWPEAVVVYMEGIPTGRLTDPEGKRNGWQHDVGEQNDRDLKFFDAALSKLRKEHKVDNHRIYATGHSNGGAFTYLLWAERHEMFAAMAPSAAGGRSVLRLKPKPAMHLAGEKDTLVQFLRTRSG